MHALDGVGGLRFNKATLFSWLVFSYVLLREGRPPIAPTFVGTFDRYRQEPREAPPVLHPVLAVYSDRASYRVGDVSSVVLRDLAISAVYSYLEGSIHGR